MTKYNKIQAMNAARKIQKYSSINLNIDSVVSESISTKEKYEQLFTHLLLAKVQGSR